MTLVKQEVKSTKENVLALERKTDTLDEVFKLMEENLTILEEFEEV